MSQKISKQLPNISKTGAQIKPKSTKNTLKNQSKITSDFGTVFTSEM